MRDNLIDKVASYLLRNHRRQRWKHIVSVLAAIVVFVTTYALILPAITLESNYDTPQGDYMYPVSGEQSAEYDIADSGGTETEETNASSEENSDEAEIPEKPQDEASSKTESSAEDIASDDNASEGQAQDEVSTENTPADEEPGAEQPSGQLPSEETTQKTDGEESFGTTEGEQSKTDTENTSGGEDKDKPMENEPNAELSVSKSGAASSVMIDGVLTDVICWQVDITTDNRAAYFLDTLNMNDGNVQTYAAGTDITITAYRGEGTSEDIICGLPGSKSGFSADTYMGDDFYIDLKAAAGEAGSSEGLEENAFTAWRIVYYTTYTADEHGEGYYSNTAQLLTADMLTEGITENTLLAETAGSCEIGQPAELVLEKVENPVMLTAAVDEWQPVSYTVTNADGTTATYSQMALIMYYCTYNASNPADSIGGYERHQMIPGTVAGYDHVDGIADIGSAYRFKIEGAYTNGTDYLIPISYLETAYGGKSYSYGTCDFDFNSNALCPFIYATGSEWSGSGGTNRYNSGIMRAATYQQLNGEWYLKITAADTMDGDDKTGYKTGVVYYAVMQKATDTYAPNSTVIHLFDYWATLERKNSDNHPTTKDELASGINENHPLKFGRNIGKNYGSINYSYGGDELTPSKVTQGIVAKTLGSDRFPQLSGRTEPYDSAVCSSFMPSDTTEEQSTESLAYLFDPYTPAEGKKSFPDVTGLLWQDEAGYYCYDSQLRGVEFNETTNSFTEYMSPAGVYTANGVSGQFFPFNDAHRTTLINADQDPLNHYFGLTLTSRFIQQYGGRKTETSDEDIIFDFKGDNDVWIFIDGVLVADLGGLGSTKSVNINFRTGEVLIDDTGTTGNWTGTPNTTIRQAFIDANPDYATTIQWNGNTFANDTLHTLKFYYLERGNFDSNLKLQYNLNQVPVSGIYKVDQYGKSINNAKFAFYRAATDETTGDYRYIGADGATTYSSADVKNFAPNPNTGFIVDPNTGNIYNGADIVIKPTYTGVTEGNGELPFLSDDGMPYSMAELEAMLGANMILREIDVPDGYRTVSDETWLSIQGGNFFCDNTYQSGVWAGANVLVTANNTLYIAREYASVAQQIAANDPTHILTVGSQQVVDGPTGDIKEVPVYSANYYSPSDNNGNGTLFSVVLKRNGRDFWRGFGYDYWFPVYGSDRKGYTVVDEGVPAEPATAEEWEAITFDNAPTNIEAVLTAAKAQAQMFGENALVFRESGNGMQLLNENLPGQINRYYTWMSNNGKLDASNPSDTDPQYVVAYYWTSADSVAEATKDNTVRVYSHNSVISGVDGMKLQWSTSIAVPDLENRLFFQKLNEEEQLVNDAVFALYDVFDAAPRKEGVSYGYNFIYYVGKGADGGKVYVAPLDNAVSNPQPGRAVVFGVNSDESVYLIGYGDYSVNSNVTIKRDENGNYDGVTGTNIGRISVTVDAPVTNADGTYVVPVDSLYYVDPAVGADGAPLIGATHDVCSQVAETGTGHFGKLKEGRYYLREITAPAGYALNPEEIPVLVNANGVYANAGAAGDGVAVGNGIGYLTSTLDFAATHGEIDETMTWVYAALIRNDAADFSAFDAVSGDVLHVGDGAGTDQWQFVTPGTAGGYGSDTSRDREDAMVTYLEFADILSADSTRENLFDYTPNLNQDPRDAAGKAGKATLEGENAIRLYTSSGWSDMAVYQDFAYGTKQLTTGNTTNYTDLTELGNISNLFSSSTFVLVQDKPRVDMAVKKVSASDPSQTLSGAQFRLYYTDKDGKNHYYKVSDSGAVGWTVKKDEAILVTDVNGLATFPDLPDGTYYLEEVSAPTGFSPIESPIALQITDRTLILSDSSLPAGVSSDGGALQPNGETLYTITVPNAFNGGPVFPETGGCGTFIYILSGLLLLAAAVCGYIIKRRREERFCK